MSSTFTDRPLKALLLMDVDGTLTPARQGVSPEMVAALKALRQKVVIGFVGGSDLVKISEQLSVNGSNVVDDFDYAFAENWPHGSFIKFIGEDRYKTLVNFCLHYIADMDIPIKRGTFIEFRNGMINVSPIGRNATVAERHEFEAYDKQHGLRAAFAGQISFDVFPRGWDKTYALKHVADEEFEEIHFFGDKTAGTTMKFTKTLAPIGHAVSSPADTIRLFKELFLDA
ncbi:eukaryotic phosphomannomutase-domain-containing protein [Roridomyces roridus]|uniref:Phosphomannomutase n=1 Tax=Roridomyces roridus TaxID=1738132 RepID=A0AAD7FGU4_9AGAR|nr:eukaryotic phosphomannomutase-domain-containing protein [Roridomyces roridus]